MQRGNIPLLTRRAVLVTLSAWMCFWSNAVTYAIPPSRSDRNRTEVLRHLIRRNLHFSIHCWCRAVDERTVSAVRRAASPEDFPNLVAVMGDADPAVGAGAGAVLVSFGADAIPALREGVVSPDRLVASNATEALEEIRLNKQFLVRDDRGKPQR